MPDLNPIKILGNLKFLSAGLKLPTAKASGDAKGWSEKYYRDRDHVAGEMSAVPKVIPPWFMPQIPGYEPHQKSCDEQGKNFKDCHDAMIDAVKFAHSMWKLQAKFQNLQIMAVTAIGSPGCLDGPELESLIKSAPQCAAFTGNNGKYRDAVAAGVSKAFKNWQDQVMVPGLPWYPAFAAFPGPQTPPMPNVPMPLIACPSAKMADIITPDTMTKEMENALDGEVKKKDPEKQYHALFDAIATVLSLAFLMWLPMQQVMLVLGKGPVPTFAPPFVPVGPVMGGDIISVPGHLMA